LVRQDCFAARWTKCGCITLLAAGRDRTRGHAETPRQILALPAAQRTRQQTQKLQAYFVDRVATQICARRFRKPPRCGRDHEKLIDSIPTTMVMKDVEPPRDTFLLERGRYDHPEREESRPGCPPSWPPRQGAWKNRLDLARWLIDPANPLTARWP